MPEANDERAESSSVDEARGENAPGSGASHRQDSAALVPQAPPLKAMIEHFPGGISMFDADLRLIACNDLFRTLLDLPAALFDHGLPTLEEIFRANAARGEYGPGAVDDLVRERLKLARSNAPHHFERIRPNGTVLEVRGFPTADGGFISTYLDVTERHAAQRQQAEAEQAERENAALLQLTLAHMSQGLSLFDAHDRLTVWNDRFARIYGLPAELLKRGTSAREISSHIRSQGFFETDRPQWRKMIAAGQTVTAKLRCADGRVIKVSYTPVRGSGWVATHEDISDKERTRIELSRQADLLAKTYIQLDAALDNMSQGLCLLDCEGHVVLTNKRLRQMYDFDEDQVRAGITVRDLVTLYANSLASGDFDIERFVAAIPNESTTVLQLRDGRLIQICRAPVPGGGWVATHEDITVREQSARQIRHLAFHDPLTGLANRTELNRRGTLALSDSGREVSLLLIDLDRFKSVNDTFGHSAGDCLLKLVAERMSTQVGKGDLIARVGGDEFAVLQHPSSDQREAAVSLAARLIAVLSEPYDLDGRQALIGASVGVALGEGNDDTMEALARRADLALYEVKSGGRNASMIYDGAIGRRADERSELENELRDAIANGQLELHYQPIVSLDSHEVCATEALVRWRHPSRGLLLPDRFIKIAEDSGLIVPLGEFVIKQACADAATWRKRVKVAVNVSPTHIRRRSLLDTVVDALLQSGLDAEQLEIEVTETVLMTQDDDVLSQLHQLKDLGLSVALDDFGTGFSSLSHLRMFSFDKVKIDRTFVAEITERTDSAAIVCAVTGLARALDMVTTAEGIETEQQLHILRAAGCTQGQGFLFGKPKPASELNLFTTDFHAATGLRRSAI